MTDLSGGERQKAYLAAALAQETDVILMDEPTTYLDIAHQFRTAALAKRLAAGGRAVVLVLHDLPLAFRTADRLAVLEAGQIKCIGTPEEVWSGGVIPGVFGVELRRFETERGFRYWCEERSP